MCGVDASSSGLDAGRFFEGHDACIGQQNHQCVYVQYDNFPQLATCYETRRVLFKFLLNLASHGTMMLFTFSGFGSQKS